MRVLLSAFVGSTNLGDEAIFSVASGLVSQHLDASLAVLSINIPKTTALPLPPKTRVIQASFRNFLRGVRSADAVVFGGGGIIQDESSVINLLYYAAQSWVAHTVLKKPVFLAYVGVGPVTSRFGHWLLRRMSSQITRSLVRDPESRDMLVDHGFDQQRIVVAYDIVFNLPVDSSTATVQDRVVFAPRDWFFTRRYLPTRFALRRSKQSPSSGLMAYRRQLVSLAAGFLERHPDTSILGVPFFGEQDTELLEWIGEHLPVGLQSRFGLVDETLTPAEYVKVAGDSRAVLGMRLHSLILGALSSAPLVPLIYSNKVQSMTAYLGLAPFSTRLSKPAFDVPSTLDHLDRALAEGGNVDRDALAHIISTNLEQSERFFELVKSDIAGS